MALGSKCPILDQLPKRRIGFARPVLVGIGVTLQAAIILFGQSPDTPVLIIEQTKRIGIYHPGLDARWQIRFPEMVASPDAIYLLWAHNPEWRQIEGGAEYSWEAPADWLEGMRKNPYSRGMPILAGVRVNAAMKPGPDRIDLRLAITNLAKEPLRDIWSEGGCLGHLTPRFFDPDGSHSLIRTSAGVERVSTLHRTQNIRSRYVANAAWADVHMLSGWEWFWGRSKVHPQEPWIIGEAAEGSGAIGVIFDHGFLLLQNSDKSHHCLHAGPLFGTIAPGKTVERRGAILFASSAHELQRRLMMLEFRADRSAPSH
jgi:hypothetical protein